MQHPDEGTIHAWIDGELSSDEAAALERHLAECPECSALAAEARGLVAASSRIVSALDIIPGDVIPKAAPRRRAWSASTQLRAAAAVIVVGGASLLVMRNGGEKKMQRTLETSAPSTVSSIPAPRTMAADAMVDTARSDAIASAPIIAKTPPKAAPAPVPTAPPTDQSTVANAAADEMNAAKKETPRDLSVRDSALAQRRRFEPTRLDEVVVTGVATAAAPELKKLRSDSAGKETAYEVSPGVEVILLDTGRPPTTMLRASAAQVKEKQMAPAAAPPPLPGVAKAAISSITWTDKRGHVMVLKGALPKEQLEALRQRLPADLR